MPNSSLHLTEKNPSFLGNIGNLTKKILKNAVFQMFSLIVAIGTIGVTYAAWTTLTTGQGATGQPVNQSLMQGIINNLNDLATRVGVLEGGLTTGGIITGPLSWSALSSILGTTEPYQEAWTYCNSLTPIGRWRIPTSDDIELANWQFGSMDAWTHKYNNNTLFPINGYPNGISYITRSVHDSSPYILGWYPTGFEWQACSTMNISCFRDRVGSAPVAFTAYPATRYQVRCVSDAY